MITLDTARREVAQASATGGFSPAFDELFETLGASSLTRDGAAQHLTASCLVFDPGAESVLLNHHRKARLWGQFGGHLEPVDSSLAEAARREAAEESGLPDFSWVSSTPIDLHVHDLSGAFGTCSRHFDVVFAACASIEQTPIASAESLAVGWFPLRQLPEALMPDLPERLPGLYAEAAGRLSARD